MVRHHFSYLILVSLAGTLAGVTMYGAKRLLGNTSHWSAFL